MRRALGIVAMLIAAAGCTPPIRARSPSPAPRTPAAASASAGPATPTPVAVNIQARRSGSRYTTIIERKGARTIYSLRATTSTIHSTGTAYDASFTQPHVTFYDRTGKTLIADAPRATVDERTRQVTMSGGVIAHAEDGTRLTAPVLVFNGANERLHGSGGVVMTSPQGAKLTGETLDGDVKLDDVVVRGATP